MRRIRFSTEPVVGWVGALAVSVSLAGCIPIAWVSPPVQIEGAVGPGSQRTQGGGAREVATAFPLRASLHPLQLSPSKMSRTVDLGVGYQIVPMYGRRAIHGPHLEVAYLYSPAPGSTPVDSMDELDHLRYGVHLKGHGLHPSADGFPGSPAGTLQVSVEWAKFSDTPFDGCTTNEDDDSDRENWEEDDEGDDTIVCGAGYAWGETAVGFFVEGSYGRLDDRDHWWVGVGMKARLPATMGAGFVFGDLD